MIRKWSVAAWPVVGAAISDKTMSAPPSTSSDLSFSGAASSMKSRCKISTPAIGSISAMSIATTWPRRVPSSPTEPTRWAATCAQPPGAAPRSTMRLPRFKRRCLSSISINLNAARDRYPSRRAAATYGSFNCRSSQSWEECLCLRASFKRTVMSRVAPVVRGWSERDCFERDWPPELDFAGRCPVPDEPGLRAMISSSWASPSCWWRWRYMVWQSTAGCGNEFMLVR